MPSLHLIERDDRIRRVPGNDGLWESGYWAIAPQTAARLVEARTTIYFHRTQTAPSFFGGTIQEYRIQPDGEFQGRVVFRFVVRADCRDVFAGPEGWGNEKKMVW